jgi:hypothetical protein
MGSGDALHVWSGGLLGTARGVGDASTPDVGADVATEEILTAGSARLNSSRRLLEELDRRISRSSRLLEHDDSGELLDLTDK